MLDAIVSLQGTRYVLTLDAGTGCWEYRRADRLGRGLVPVDVVARVRSGARKLGLGRSLAAVA